MNKRQPSLIFLLMLAVLVLNACGIPLASTPTPLPPGLAKTLADQTMAVLLNLVTVIPPSTPEFLSPTPSLTQTGLTLNIQVPMQTSFPVFTPTPNLSPVISSTSSFIINVPQTTVTINHTIENQPECVNAAKFIKDVTIPDGTTVTPGQEFVKVWQLKNSGTCTWTIDYSIVHTWGNRMSGKSPQFLDQIVQPGEIVNISNDLIAPNIPACWVGTWKLQDNSGNRFGTGYKSGEAFWVIVSVEIPGIPRFLFGGG